MIDETNLNDIMLTAADPDEAVEYFKRTAKDNPNRIDIRRGLAASLVRAKKNSEAVRAWKSVAEHPEATESDQGSARGDEGSGVGRVVLQDAPRLGQGVVESTGLSPSVSEET